MGESSAQGFKSTLAPLLEEGDLEGAVAYDLDDLLETSEQLCALLREIAEGGMNWSRSQLESKLFIVQIMIEQDLPLIYDDLMPPLQKLSGEILGQIRESKD